MLNRILFKLAKRYLSYKSIDQIYHEKKSVHDDEQYKQSIIIKKQAKKDMLEFLAQKGANFQQELERQDFIAVRLNDNNTFIPDMTHFYWIKNVKQN